MTDIDPLARISRDVLAVAVHSMRERRVKEIENLDNQIYQVKELENIMITSKSPLSYEKAVMFEGEFSQLIEDFQLMKSHAIKKVVELDELIRTEKFINLTT